MVHYIITWMPDAGQDTGTDGLQSIHARTSAVLAEIGFRCGACGQYRPLQGGEVVDLPPPIDLTTAVAPEEVAVDPLPGPGDDGDHLVDRIAAPGHRMPDDGTLPTAEQLAGVPPPAGAGATVLLPPHAAAFVVDPCGATECGG